MAYTAPIDEKQLVKDLQTPRVAKEAFNTLMRTYSEPVYWQIRRMVGNHEDANDLLQNCFLKAWSNLHNFRGDAKLSTWLYKIAVNETINFLNKERQRAQIQGDEHDDEILLSRLTSDEYFDGDALQVTFQKAVMALPEKQRLVFNMRYYNEKKYEEISEILGTSVGALKASYHHAVKKISAAIKASEIS